jgi:8-oxo-dGTP pyrophosphatase MutT (NUDIX family)
VRYSPLGLLYKAAFPIARTYWTVVGGHLYGVRCVITYKEDILLIRHTYGNKNWSLPGGRIAKHESPATAARREIKEETGISVGSLLELGEFTMSAGRLQDKVIVFCAKVAQQEVTIDPNEIQEACWFNIKYLPSLQSRHLKQSLRLYLESVEKKN